MAYLLAHLGLNFRRRGYREEGKIALLEAETWLESIQDKRIKLYVLRQIGNSYNNSVETASLGIPYLEKSLALALETHDLDAASAYNALGNIYASLQRHEDAISTYVKCANAAEKFGNESMKAIALMNTGNIYYQLQDYPKALAFNLEAYNINLKIGAKLGNPASSILGTLVQMDSSLEEILVYLQQSLREGLDSRNLAILFACVETCAFLRLRAGAYEQACELFGLNFASPLFDPDDPSAVIQTNQALATIAQHLSQETIQNAIERGKKFDIMTTAQALYEEFCA